MISDYILPVGLNGRGIVNSPMPYLIHDIEGIK